jgi:Cu/Ag efflux pump CusA
MSDGQRIPDSAREEAHIDWAILNLIDEDNWRPRSIEEIIREYGNQLDALDSLDRLFSAGLIHRIDDFVFASRAPVRYHEIAE